MTLSREDILSADDIKYVDVPVLEWGGSVRVGTMSGKMRDRWEVFLVNNQDDDKTIHAENIRATLVALCVEDDEGELLFTLDDVIALGKKSGGALDRVYAVAKTFNRLSQKDMEDVGKNSGGDPSDDSGT